MYQAINKVLTDPSVVRSEQLSFGAVLPTLFTASREGSSAIRKLSDNIREGAASLVATRWANERANLMTGEAAKIMAEDWKENGIPKNERWKIRELGLTKDEVAEIDSGNMRDFTFRKVIQASVAKSQYNMEFAWNKAPLENSPIGRMIFAYNSYMLGQTRSAINFASHAWEFMKSSHETSESSEGYGLDQTYRDTGRYERRCGNDVPNATAGDTRELVTAGERRSVHAHEQCVHRGPIARCGATDDGLVYV
jgi:hypothetical protein